MAQTDEEYRKEMMETKKKADAGDVDAQYDMAWYCVWENDEPPYDKGVSESAVDYFEQAANQGHLDAMLDLGAIYLGGSIGIPADFDKAVFWYKKAAEQLHPKAFRCLGYALGYHGFNDNFRDYAAAYQYFVKGALLGEENSLYELGDLYANGLSVEKDEALAFVLYQQSYDIIDDDLENDSYADVCLRLGECYLDGKGTEKDMEKAVEYLKKSKEGFEYRADFEPPITWEDTALAELDKVNRLLKNLSGT